MHWQLQMLLPTQRLLLKSTVWLSIVSFCDRCGFWVQGIQKKKVLFPKWKHMCHWFSLLPKWMNCMSLAENSELCVRRNSIRLTVAKCACQSMVHEQSDQIGHHTGSLEMLQLSLTMTWLQCCSCSCQSKWIWATVVGLAKKHVQQKEDNMETHVVHWCWVLLAGDILSWTFCCDHAPSTRIEHVGHATKSWKPSHHN